ncbi:MAG: hypothetical protein ACYCOR_18270 [Acidobacteriaceae bacterium]
MTVNGTNFVAASAVQWNGASRTTSYVSATKLTAQINSSDIATAGNANITVVDPGASGGTSTALKFAINSAPVQGTLNLTITGLPAGTPASVTVTGPNGYSSQVTSSQTLQLAPGTYTVVGSPVNAGISNYYPATASQTETISSTTPASVTVDYATIVPNTTKVLDSVGMQSLTVSPNGSTITISTSSAVANSLAVGDVLASAPATAAPNGLLVKILSVSTSGQIVTANVQQATLEDAIQQGTFQFSETLGPGNTTPQMKRRASPRREFLGPHSAAAAGGACAGNSNTIQLPFNVQIAGGGTTALTLKGEDDFCPSVSFSFQISGSQLISLNATVTTGDHASIGLLDSAAGTFNSTQNLGAFTTAQTVVLVGNVPITVQAVLIPFVGASGSASANLATGVITNSTSTISATYANGSWSPVHSITSPTVASSATSVDGQVTLKAFAGVQAGFSLDGVATPNLSNDGYLQFNSGLSANPCWTLNGGLEGSVAVNVTILGKNLTSYTSSILNLYSTTVAQAANTCFAPMLSSINPNMALAMSPDTTIALSGSNFVPDSVANFNGQPLSTTFVDPNDLTAIVPSSDLASGGTFPITVTNPDNPGGTSNPVTFTVSAVTVTVAPPSATVPVGKTQQFTATVQGTSNTAVSWSVNGTPGGNSTVGTITSDGLYTAPATVPTPATITVTATSQAQSNISASANVAVTALSYTYATIDDPSGSLSTQAYGINSTEQIVGTYSDTSGGGHGFLYSNGNFSTIDYPGPGTSSTNPTSTDLNGINANNEIVGNYNEAANNIHIGFLYSAGNFKNLGDDPASISGGTSPEGINDNGDIVGLYTDSSGNDHGFLYSNGAYTTIDDPNGALGTQAFGINNNGQIVGIYFDANSVPHGFSYTISDKTFTTIDYPGTIFSTQATGINDNGQITGWYTNNALNYAGFLDNGQNFTTIFDPSSPGSGAGATIANGININGQIVGWYLDANNKQHGFLATPN